MGILSTTPAILRMGRHIKNINLLWVIPVFSAILVSCSGSKKNQASPPGYNPIQLKYASSLEVAPDSIINHKLYNFIEKWMNTPYKWGGDDKSGIDCSALVRKILREVYEIEIPRVSVDQFLNQRIVRYGNPKYLHEGDLVFFTLDNTRSVTHVGLYLQNNRFINAQSGKGVCIGNLKSSYWKTKLVAYGRVKGG